jgi:hypothetical protein
MTLKRSLAVIRRPLLAAFMMVALSWASVTHAQVLGPTAVSDLVTLHDAVGGGPCDWTRLTYNGGMPFFVPSTMALVITSIQWSQPGAVPDRRSHLQLIRAKGTPIKYTDPVYGLLAIVDGGLADIWGRNAGQATFPTGLVVDHREGSLLCVNVEGADDADMITIRVTLQGYLTPVVRRVP